MIYVFHGTDTQTTYLKAQKLAESLIGYEKIKIGKDNIDLFFETIQTEDMFVVKKVVICQNLLSKKLVEPKKIKQIPTGIVLIFWEEQEIPSAKLKSFKDAKIDNSKLPSTLFYFLDSIVPDSKKSLELLKKADDKNSKLLWHLANRTLLLILVKLNFQIEDVAKVTGRNIAPWQWDKLTNQAKMFSNVEDLKKLFFSTLKIDLMQKTGKTDLPESTLITFMLFRYIIAH